ncbi:MFS transporter [Vibrio sp. SM6]|uniref:MFS transporter n=1 Tax=Vibrio agarilyticus TaxID=2726741 RepID=A0A7X8YIE2_9VIBR|nr:MFS transporter [Vibrio agarilyticus]NLS14515.1 MFS transporter [Vibrio agarilyticus]
MLSDQFSTSLWANHTYTRLFSAQVISLIGTGMSSVCLALLAYDLAGDDASRVLATVFALKMITYIVFAPLITQWVQHWPKRPTLVTLDLLRAMTFLALPLVNAVWQVYLLIVLINLCSAAFTPLYQATLPQVVTRSEDYAKALSFSRIAYDCEQIISPILTALLLGWLSFRTLFAFDAATFLLSGLLIMSCRLPGSKPTNSSPQAPTHTRKLTAGLSDYLKQRQLRSLWFAYLAVAAASAMVLVNTVVYVHQVLHGDERETAVAMLLVGIGSIATALKLPTWLRDRTPNRFHLLGISIIGMALVLGAQLPSWFGFAVVSVALGVGMSLIQTTSGLIIQKAADKHDASAYFAAHFSLTHFWWLITYLIAGMTAQQWGLDGAFWSMLLLCSLSAIMVWITQRTPLANNRDASTS